MPFMVLRNVRTGDLVSKYYLKVVKENIHVGESEVKKNKIIFYYFMDKYVLNS